MLPDTEATHTNQLCPAQGEKTTLLEKNFLTTDASAEKNYSL